MPTTVPIGGVPKGKAVDEAKDIRDKAEAMRAYAKQARNRGLEVDAAEIRIKAERRLGELIKAQRETVGLARGGQPYQSTGADEEPVDRPPTLAEVGIDKKLSSRSQKLAAVPEDKFDGMIAEWRERVGKENERVTKKFFREGEKVQRDAGLNQAPLPPGKFELIYAVPTTIATILGKPRKKA